MPVFVSCCVYILWRILILELCGLWDELIWQGSYFATWFWFRTLFVARWADDMNLKFRSTTDHWLAVSQRHGRMHAHVRLPAMCWVLPFSLCGHLTKQYVAFVVVYLHWFCSFNRTINVIIHIVINAICNEFLYRLIRNGLVMAFDNCCPLNLRFFFFARVGLLMGVFPVDYNTSVPPPLTWVASHGSLILVDH